MLVGYARVSTQEQTLALQQDALKSIGCERIFTDTASGAQTDRTGLDEALRFVRAGDTLVVWRLDRLGRSLKHLIETIGQLQERGIGFRSIQESIDIFHVFGALAEFERDLIRERTNAGLAAARARGIRGGRPKRLTLKQVAQLQSLHDAQTTSISDLLDTFRISRTTLYRYIATRSPGCLTITSMRRLGFVLR
jgi:DNA invertase Pin-like site-specific DNA recombinase